MRPNRLLAAGFAIVAVAACTTSTPGWTYAPASPSAIPSAAAPSPSGSVAPSPSGVPSASASAPASGAASQSAPPGSAEPSTVVELSAQNITFDKTELSVPPDLAFQIVFTNNDASVDHNVEIRDTTGATIFQGEVFPGVESRTYDAPPLPAGSYQFLCSVHPSMTGTLTAQ
jgi:plastocyanin